MQAMINQQQHNNNNNNNRREVKKLASPHDTSRDHKCSDFG